MALGIGNVAVVQNLEQDVEYIGMGFLHLIEQHHGIGIAADLLTQLAASLIAYISWRRADHLGNAVLLHIFRHIDADQRVFRSKHGFRQRLAQLRFSHACGPQKQEGADGPLGIL